MIAKVKTSILDNTVVRSVEVEAEIHKSNSDSEARFEIIGLADTAIREARQRVLSVLKKSGVKIRDKVLINLSPAELKKDGSGLDLPILISLLIVTKKLEVKTAQEIFFYGELGLDGKIQPVRNIIAHLLHLKEQKYSKAFVPAANYQAARLVSGLEIVPVSSIKQVICCLENADFQRNLVETAMKQPQNALGGTEQDSALPDFSDVAGQHQAKRAMLIAAAGGHHMLMIGPPGCGKSMLAKRFNSLLPRLSEDELLAVAQIYSTAKTDLNQIFAGVRPFRAPHYQISVAGLTGGGAVLKPGEISLAHRGVLFLDELPEFQRKALEALRVPLESGELLISRANYSFNLPADFQLIAAMNPCPCGKLGASQYQGKQGCLCSPYEIKKYLAKISGPLLDRIDLQVSLDAIEISEIDKQLSSGGSIERGAHQQNCAIIKSAKEFRTDVRQQAKLNAALNNQEILGQGELCPEAKTLLNQLSKSKNISARSYFRVIRVARTIADLAQEEAITTAAIAEAFSYRSFDLIQEYCQ